MPRFEDSAGARMLVALRMVLQLSSRNIGHVTYLESGTATCDASSAPGWAKINILVGERVGLNRLSRALANRLPHQAVRLARRRARLAAVDSLSGARGRGIREVFARIRDRAAAMMGRW